MPFSNTEEVTQLTVKQLLGSDDTYLIPMYQRNYAWEKGEITQLIQDIIDYMPEQRPYYIGSLVVFRRQADRSARHTVFETIDGQQRLTTLSLLTSYLKNNGSANTAWYRDAKIHFESRPLSKKTFDTITNRHFHKEPSDALKPEEINTGITNGYRLIGEALDLAFKNSPEKLQHFERFLFEQVQVMRIQVPDDTDLNHYFEIMNSRGEQLEKHEVLKAKLLEVLNQEPDDAIKESSKRTLHLVWESCANMEKYAQSGFSPKLRNELFGDQKWDELQPKNFEQLCQTVAQHSEESSADESKALSYIIANPVKERTTTEDGDDTPDRFNSVINFPNFLLHILRISVNEGTQAHTDNDVPLDDKRLIQLFEEHILKAEAPLERSRKFIFNLLKGKHLFDHYIIKREFLKGSDSWSLKRYKWNKGDSRNSLGKSSYVNTFDGGDDQLNRSLLMLLSAFHVSTPTMVYKHWLNAALNYLFSNESDVIASEYLTHMEGVARAFVFDRYLVKGEGASYYEMIYRRKGKPQRDPGTLSAGDISPQMRFTKIKNNLVFNYLDYLLWQKYRNDNSQKQIANYEFTFRSSVEHYYPQTPMEGVKDMSDDPSLHYFGNLCLISHSKNSRLSNFSPAAKKDYYAQNSIDSPKQHLMMQFDNWDKAAILEHEEEMISTLLNTDTAAS
ncbi:DUF262 domain-containing protein [Sulfuriroseicoccus oceanibius]|uniref:DUF262 domain-containing protein n=1 Tax=Sulfuriroseicoccus oceanibius TaxID=2707525 RepID=A0A6B3L048_9BACT|nr:DUF262 domain-containing protein [Sulfuriroseicoccus oceanibius]QQL43716.1 DUF262 domain-containing protein [Sulfuriroseicoccus oceanibius]